MVNTGRLTIKKDVMQRLAGQLGNPASIGMKEGQMKMTAVNRFFAQLILLACLMVLCLPAVVSASPSAADSVHFCAQDAPDSKRQCLDNRQPALTPCVSDLKNGVTPLRWRV